MSKHDYCRREGESNQFQLYLNSLLPTFGLQIERDFSILLVSFAAISPLILINCPCEVTYLTGLLELLQVRELSELSELILRFLDFLAFCKIIS